MSHPNHRPRRRTAISCALLVTPLAAGLGACGGDGGNPLAATPYDAGGQISRSVADEGRAIDPDKPLVVTATGDDGRITDVTATDATGRYLQGELAADGTEWRSTGPLAAGARYTVRVSTEDSDGRPGRKTLAFDTASTGRLLGISFGPAAGTYGVGQPVTAQLSRPVTDRAARALVERHLHVTSSPAAAEGSWHWVDNRTLHYRPREYWPAGARIEVRSSLDGIHVQKGVHGGPAGPLALTIGDRVEAVTDAGSHLMTFKRNGEVVRTIPVTTGKPGFDTRNGIKVVLGQESLVRMRSTTVGIAEGSSESYDLPVYWATRVTWSGEYVHAAPWSTGAQGSANVSHGCTGMSTEDAHWFYDQVRVGDIVEVVNSLGDRMTPFDNGFGDWNLGWDAWREGSALGQAGAPAADRPAPAAAQARLRPGT